MRDNGSPLWNDAYSEVEVAHEGEKLAFHAVWGEQVIGNQNAGSTSSFSVESKAWLH